MKHLFLCVLNVIILAYSTQKKLKMIEKMPFKKKKKEHRIKINFYSKIYKSFILSNNMSIYYYSLMKNSGLSIYMTTERIKMNNLTNIQKKINAEFQTILVK